MALATRHIAVIGTVLALAPIGLSGCGRTAEKEPQTETIAVVTPPISKPFCETVFAAAMVGKLIAVRGLQVRPSTKQISGLGECQLYVDGARGRVELSLVADCRPQHPRLASHKKVLAGKPGYREVALGIGGVYTFEEGLHRLVFEMPDPACTMYLGASGLKKDPTSVLGLRVARALSVQTMPR